MKLRKNFEKILQIGYKFLALVHFRIRIGNDGHQLPNVILK